MADRRWSLSDHIDRDATDLKRRFLKDRDIRYAAMAIGRWPHNPPPWAMIACHAEHEKWIRQASRGNSKDVDGAVLDEVIRCYFRIEDEAQRDPNYKPSNYIPPNRSTVVTMALRNVEGRTPEDGDRFRARYRAVSARLDEELHEEGQLDDQEPDDQEEDGPAKILAKLQKTTRYHRILQEWGEQEVGAPTYLLSFQLYLQRIAEEGSD